MKSIGGNPRSGWGLLVSLAAVLASGLGSGVHAQDMGAAAQPPAAVQPPADNRSSLPGPPAIRPGGQVSVMLFDLQNAAMDKVAGAAAATAAQNNLKAGFIFSGRFDLVTFSRRLALIKKAESDEILRLDDFNGLNDPATGDLDVTKARTIARLVRVQTVLSGTIEEATVNRMANSAAVALTVQLINSVTGEVMKSAGVSGTASGSAETSSADLAAMAGRDAALKALAEFGISPEAAEGPPAVEAAEGDGGGSGDGDGDGPGFFGGLWNDIMDHWREMAFVGSFGVLTAILAWR